MVTHQNHHAPSTGREPTRLAFSATLHCLTGCAIGEVLGMVLATWWDWGNGAKATLSYTPTTDAIVFVRRTPGRTTR